MNNYKAPSPNFDSSYIYKVEEREENEEIIRQSARGLLSIESNVLPKVTRYFLRNEKGEPQGYIESKFVQNSKFENLTEKDLCPQNSKNEKVKLGPPMPKQENKMKVDSQVTLKSEKKSSLPKRFYHSRERCHTKKYNAVSESISLVGSIYDRSINYNTLDYTSANSTPSGKMSAIKHIASSSDTFTLTGTRVERKFTKEKVSSKVSMKKPSKIFCKDPNQRLKNLFTIIKPNEKIKEKNSCNDIDLLNKTKELLVKLIDNELQRIKTDDNASKNVKENVENFIDKSILKTLKLECMRKIEDELRLLKTCTVLK